MIIGKVFKGFYRDLYDDYMLTAPTNEKGHPLIPSRQLCATWVVQAWEKVPEELICKAWDLANYKTVEEISLENCSRREITQFAQQDIVKTLGPVVDETVLMHYLAEDNVYCDKEFCDENVGDDYL